MTILSKFDFDSILLSRDVEDRLEHLREIGTLLGMLPEVQALVGFGGGDTGHKDLWGHTKQVVSQCVRRTNVRWAALFHDVGKVKCFTRNANGVIAFHGHEAESARLFRRAADRLRFFTKDEREAIHFLIHHLGYIEEYDSNWTDSAVRRIYKHTINHFEDIVALARADITTKHAYKRAQHQTRMQEFWDRALEIARKDAIPPALPTGLGDVLSQEFGIPKSKKLGNLMAKLKEAVEMDKLDRQPTVEAVLQYVRDHKLV